MSGHILAIDAGNTRIKWGLHDGKEWLLRHAVATTDIADGLAVRSRLNASEIDYIVVSNVAGPLVGRVIEDQFRSFGKPVWFVTAQASQCGVVNGYERPVQLGSDRWAALIGARAAATGASRALLVVMCGTALTVDALNADGHFLGGIIAPGLALMHRAMHRGTVQLSAASGQYQRFPTSTANAMTSGAVEACAGAVERMYAHLSAETGDTPACICSGGAIVEIAPHLSFPTSINDNLVLDGLLVIANAKTPRTSPNLM